MRRDELLLHTIQKIGDFQREHWRTGVNHKTKKDALDVLSFVDIESENMLRKALETSFPDDAILGEESYDRNYDYTSHEYVWVVDPLDGTLPFLRGLHYFGSSIACLHHGEVVHAACYFPALDELYFSDGGPTLFNGNACYVSQAKSLEESVFFVNQNNLHEFTKDLQKKSFISMTPGRVIDFYTITYELCLVASGRCEAGFMYHRGGVWDTAAGAFLVQQAGGRVTKLDGSQWDPFEVNCLFSNGQIHDDLLARFAP